MRNATEAAATTPPVSSHACAVARASNATIKAAATQGNTRPAGMTNGLSADPPPTSSRRSRHTPRQHARYTRRIATSAMIASLTYVPDVAILLVYLACCLGVWRLRRLD